MLLNRVIILKGLKLKYMKNVKKPNSFLGRIQLHRMNKHHFEMAKWGWSNIKLANKTNVLDIGCGGGNNIKHALKYNPTTKVFGLDYSNESVKMSLARNKKAVKLGRLQIVQASVENIPFADNSFDLITAFETVYFWNIEKAFLEVYRVLQPNGEFCIVNEACTPIGMEENMNDIGFNVYTAKELVLSMTKAGFHAVKSIVHENGKWITIIGKK